MAKKFSSISQMLTDCRGFIQAGAALLTNIHLPNFLRGGLYRGAGKTVCVPGLNCYSCPAASAACPIGAFQAVVGSSKFSFSYYITGFLILLGVLLGRFICGFLCPFGWFQELLHKIPTKKLSTKRLKPLTYLKYIILLLPPRSAGGRYPSVSYQFRYSSGSRLALYLEIKHFTYNKRAEHSFLPPLLQMALSLGCILCFI